MRIYKYVHFCFPIEHDGEELLFDPGKFSFVEGRFKLDVFGDVSTVVITHSHPDHIAVETSKRILTLSGACAMANAEAASKVLEEGIGVIPLEDSTHQRSMNLFYPTRCRLVPRF